MKRATLFASLGVLTLGVYACDKPADTGADTDSLNSSAAEAGGGALVTAPPAPQSAPAGPMPGNASEALGASTSGATGTGAAQAGGGAP